MDFMDQLEEMDRPTVEKKDWMDKCVMELVTEDRLDTVVDLCIKAGLYALDLETTGLDSRVFFEGGVGRTVDKIVGYCLSHDGVHGYYIPVRHVDSRGNILPVNVSAVKAAAAMRRLEESDAVAIFHNGKFDHEFLQFGEGDPIGIWDSVKKWEDTLILAYLRNTRERNKGLKSLSFQELGKEMIELPDLFPEKQRKSKDLNFSTLDPTWEPCVWYACSDAICTYLLFKGEGRFPGLHAQVHDPEPHGISQSTVYKLEKMCLPATRWMERYRINIDREKIEELIRLGQAEWFEALGEVYKEAGRILGRDITPGHYRLMEGTADIDDPSLYKFVADQLSPTYMDQVKETRKAAHQRALDPMEVGPNGKNRIRTIVKEVPSLANPKKRENINFPTVYDVATTPAQLGLLLRELGVKGLVATEKSGQVKTSKDVLDAVIEKAGTKFPFMGKVKRFRETAKALGTNLFPIWHDTTPKRAPDGCIRVNFNAHKVDTGRFATPKPRKPQFHGTVRWNLHSIPAGYDKSKPACMLRIRECIKARPGRILVACVAEGSLVQTGRGLIPIEKVKVGDQVVTENGLASVTGARCTGHRELLRLTTYKGLTVRVTPDHLVQVVGDNGLTWKEAGDLRPGDWLVQIADGALTETQTELPTITVSPWETPIKVPRRMSPELSRFLGRFMGDGCIGHEQGKIRYVGLSLGLDCNEVLPEVNRLFDELFGLSFTPKGRGDVHCWSQPLGRWLEAVTGKGSQGDVDYGVPEAVLRSSVALWPAFLRGLLDADGSVGSRGGDAVSIWITSTRMAQEVQLMLLGLGISSRRAWSERETNYGHQEGWFLTITGIKPLRRFFELVGMDSVRKQGALGSLQDKGRNRDISNFLPLQLVKLAIRKQSSPATNAAIRNGRRCGRVSYEALERCSSHPKEIRQEWMDRLLRGPLQFDTLVETRPDGQGSVYDLKVPDAHYFTANGLVVHNCDYSGVELRIVTNASREPKWLEEFFRCSGCNNTFDRGDGMETPPCPPPFCPKCGSDKIGDLHTLTAIAVYGAAVVNSAEFKGKRQKAKALNFAMCYGGGGLAAQRAVGVDKDEGWRLKRQFDQTYTGLEGWWGQQHRFAKKYKYVVTAFNRRYPLPDIDHESSRWRSKAERNAVNGPIQGCSADITKLAMGLIYKAIKKKGWLKRVYMIITIHDELVFEIDEEIAEEAIELIAEVMTRNKPVLRMKFPVPLKVDTEIGDDWTVPYNLTELKWNKSRKPWTPGLIAIFPRSYTHYLKVGGKPIEGVKTPEVPDDPEDESDGGPSGPTGGGSTGSGSTGSGPTREHFERPGTQPGKPFTHVIHTRQLKWGLLDKLARLILRCENGGTSPLRIETEAGEPLWEDDVLVSPTEFVVLAREYKI